jgi:rRNA maturation endonuclease Nob1
MERGINFPHQHPSKLFEINYQSNVMYNHPYNSINSLNKYLSKIGLKTDGWLEPEGNRKYLLDNNISEEKIAEISNTFNKINPKYTFIDNKPYFIVGTDGSLFEDGKAGIGISFGPDITANIGLRTECTDTSLGAELEAILRAIYVTPSIHNLLIITDSLNSIKILSGKIDNKVRRMEEYPIICNILYLIDNRVGDVKFEHIYSHQDNKNNTNITNRNNEIIEKYDKNNLKYFISLNILADINAKVGASSICRDIKKPTIGFPKVYLVKDEKNKQLFTGTKKILGGGYKYIIDKNINIINVNNLCKLLGKIDINFLRYSKIYDCLQGMLGSFPFKLRSGTLDFGVTRNRTIGCIRNSYNAFKTIANPSSFCELGCSKEEVLNDAHIFNSCKNKELTEIRDKTYQIMRDTITKMPEIIKKNKGKLVTRLDFWNNTQYSKYVQENDYLEYWKVEPLQSNVIPADDYEELDMNPGVAHHKYSFSTDVEQLDTMSFKELREALSKRGYKTNGPAKEDLINRILYHNRRRINQINRKENPVIKINLNDDLNNNIHNNVRRVQHNIPNNDNKSKMINTISKNLIIVGYTTQENINTRNRSLNALANGKIMTPTDRENLNKKLSARGIVNDDLINHIKLKLGLNNNDIVLINKIARIMVNIYTIGCFEMFKCFKRLNYDLRINEGVNIKNFVPFVIKANPPEIEVIEDHG